MSEEGHVKRVSLYDDGIGSVEYVDHMGDDLTIVNAARVSFGKHKSALDDRDKKLIDYLVRHKHTSTFEHNVVTLRFVVPLFVRSQHHRHRTWSYNEISRRYTDIDIRFYEPERLRAQSKSNRQASTEGKFLPFIKKRLGYASTIIKRHHKKSLKLYEDLLTAGVCREQARGVLPQNLYTEYYGTVNLSNLLKYIDLRMHPGAQWEIQKVAEGCLLIAEELWPIAVEAYRSTKCQA